MSRNLMKLHQKVTYKYPLILNHYEGMIWVGKKPLSDKARNILLCAVLHEMKDKYITSAKYKYLNNLFKEYYENRHSLRLMSVDLAGDFDGDVPPLDTFVSPRPETCIHRFSNGNSALVTIGDDKCRCELCNLELGVDIVDDDDLVDSNKVIEDIKKLNLKSILKDDEE